MAPGAFSILGPLLGRKSKKYEKLETEDPNAASAAKAGVSTSSSASGDKKRQQQEAATQEEINRKIVSYFTL